MPRPPVVAVYGVLHDEHRSRRLGGGVLVMDKLVTLHDEVLDLLNSAHPPRVQRVGIGCVRDGEVFVEVIEVAEVLPSSEILPGSWALELATRAESPSVQDELEASEGEPTGLWCRMFPTASFC
jgi:hypothetical protein